MTYATPFAARVFLTVGLLGLGAPAFAAEKPAISKGQTATAPVPGKTSFTAAEAKARMEKRGYTVATDPVKAEDGIWHATGSREGRSALTLMVDYQGNVFEAATPNMPASGPTKITSDQAVDLMAKRGYTVSSIPIKDDKGIWYAEGKLQGRSAVQVMVDYQGNVFESAEYYGHPNSAPNTPMSPPNPVSKAPLPAQPTK